MQSFKRTLIDVSILCAIVLTFALAWGSPFVSGRSALAGNQMQQQASQNAGKTGTFVGTILKNGEQYLLRDSSGATFGLDDPDRASAYVGKTVKVTGELNERSKVIHVESIEAAG